MKQQMDMYKPRWDIYHEKKATALKDACEAGLYYSGWAWEMFNLLDLTNKPEPRIINLKK